MKKITLLFILLIGFSVQSQEKKTFVSKFESLTTGQSAFIALINRYYPEFSLPTKMLNVYDSDKQIAESYIEYPKPPNDCNEYLITVQPDNKRLDYEFQYAVGNGNLVSKGSIYILGSDVYKVDTAIKGKSKYFFQLYKNGKEVYSDNPYEGLN
ncbi:hypothetical protein [Flavobacterium sp. fv08]|uniref:hypothetical protein n=1 Tax=Flavobacterium sp. fv08 TaxID=1761784 RepID=UPI0008CB4163|nr:hypothetical protein [Flavobacterium sp. fv08]SEO25397.1 hypothetical protein SAMN04487978_2549 [Flavobacterium sp. fv08]